MRHLWRWEITSSEGTTQGDPLAMAMYALAVKPLIGKLKLDSPNVKQVWYADDASGAGTCEDLRTFWNTLQAHGEIYGYHPNASKIHLVIKPEHAEKARELFAGTGINITTEGKQHLGAAITPWSCYRFQIIYLRIHHSQSIEVVKIKSNSWLIWPELNLIHRQSSRWTFLSQTIPDIADLLQPLEEAIQQYLIPILTGRPSSQSTWVVWD